MSVPAFVPKVSIVIPTYNRGLLLCEAIESCLKQTFTSFEVIIVDDGSTDGTQEIVAQKLQNEWKEKIQISYVRQENKGASAARNHALRLAKGEYIQFLDSDDLLVSTKLGDQVVVLEQAHNLNAACCYCCGLMGVDLSNTESTALKKIGIPGVLGISEIISALCSRIVHGMQTSSPLWRRDYLKKYDGWREDISLGDDLEYHIRLLAGAEKVCFVDECLFFVREHPGSRLSADKMSEASLGSLVRTRQAIYSTLQKAGLWDAGTQRAFLGAMRTIYANALQLGNRQTIRDLESWLWRLANNSEHGYRMRAIILLRRFLGKRFLLGAHKLLTVPKFS